MIPVEYLLFAMECRVLIQELHRVAAQLDTSPDFEQRTRYHINAISDLVNKRVSGGMYDHEVQRKSVFTDLGNCAAILVEFGNAKLNLLIQNLTFASEARGVASAKMAIQTLCELENLALAKCR